MLILTRRPAQSIVFILPDGRTANITVMADHGGARIRNQVRLGIDAPDDVIVHREEVYKRIQQDEENVGNI